MQSLDISIENTTINLSYMYIVVHSNFTVFYGGPQLSRQKQIVSPQKQVASRQQQTGYDKSKLEMAKANWKWQQPVGKSRKQIYHGKSKLYTEEVPNS